MNFVFASTNLIKIMELSLILGICFDRKAIDTVEIQGTLQEIAVDKLQKALEMKKFKGKIVIVDDTGVGLDCLHEFPGQYGKDFLGKISAGEIYDICERLGNFGATKTTVLGIGYVVRENGEERTVIETFSHKIHGRIVKPINSEVTNRFAHVFSPDSLRKKGFEEKDILSHYYLRKLIKELSGYVDNRVEWMTQMEIWFPEDASNTPFDWVDVHYKNMVGNRGHAGRKLLEYIKSVPSLNKRYVDDVKVQSKGWRERIAEEYRRNRYKKMKRNIKKACDFLSLCY